MKNKIIAIILGVLLSMVLLTGCNYNIVDTKWDFKYAYITFPDGSIKEIGIKSWAEDETSVTIKSTDGNTYCVSMINCMLTEDKWEGYNE